MARVDNLSDYLKDIANALRTKKGSSELIKAEDFDEEILNLPSGGESTGEAPMKDINLYDIDGTRLYSYTLDEIQGLSEMPQAPTHDGLTFQKWNYTLEQLKSEGKESCVGALYITNDGKTRIKLNPVPGLTYHCEFIQTVTNGVEVNWGDGSAIETSSTTDTNTGTSNFASFTHTYQTTEPRVITLNPIGDCIIKILGANGYARLLYSSTNIQENYACTIGIKEINLGKNIILSDYAFYEYRNMETITVPDGTECYATSTSTGAKQIFYNCYHLKAGVMPLFSHKRSGQYFYQYCFKLKIASIPYGVTNIETTYLSSVFDLYDVTIPSTVTSISTYFINTNYSLKKISVIQQSISIGTSFAQNCYGLTEINMSNINATSVSFPQCWSLRRFEASQNAGNFGSSAFQNCYGLTEFICGRSYNRILNTTFQNCYSLALVDLRAFNGVVTLNNVNAFTSTPTFTKIVVPDSQYDRYKTASNWSNSAIVGKIIKASDYEASL